MKNALQMDPVATGAGDQRFITKVYIGDLDGKVWRFALGMTGTTVNVSTPDAAVRRRRRLSAVLRRWPPSTSAARTSTSSSAPAAICCRRTASNQSYSLLVLLDNGATAHQDGRDSARATTDGVAAATRRSRRSQPSPATSCSSRRRPTARRRRARRSRRTCTRSRSLAARRTTRTTTAADHRHHERRQGQEGRRWRRSGDSTKVFSSAGARATAPFIVDQHLVFSAGGKHRDVWRSRTTSTTASARPACASCRGGWSADGQSSGGHADVCRVSEVPAEVAPRVASLSSLPHGDSAAAHGGG